MTDKELLEQVFGPARQMTVADNGFSDRVMEKIPRHDAKRLSRLWTVFCIAVAAALFIVFGGIQLVSNGLLMLLKAPMSRDSLLMLTLSAVVVWLMAIFEVLSRERLRLV